mmetsp:Transcript_84113/g.136354  ORF Transcript_84113/g.136354 Transcript_84113/m.136354 type:complete len:102 (+) Transcript_84113:206-511(+)
MEDIVGDGEKCRQGQHVIMSRPCAAYERCNQYAGWVGVLQSRVSPGVWVVHFPAMHLGSTIQVPMAKHGGGMPTTLTGRGCWLRRDKRGQIFKHSRPRQIV